MSLFLDIDCRKQFERGAVVAPRGQWTLATQSVAAVFGPSGGGKSTLLRLLAGLERPDQGRIAVDGQAWCDVARGQWLGPAQRPIGMLAQDYALFPHLTAVQNVAFGLRHLPAAARRRRAAELLAELDLAGLEDRLPGQLSGGQQQRVALARALAREPRLLLLDEPLGALDLPTRRALGTRLRRWLRQRPAATLLVTHDPEEALALADTVWVLSGGTIRQTGPVEQVFQQPADAEVAGLVGVETVRPARLVAVAEGLARLTVGGAELFALAGELSPGDVYVCIRAADVLLERQAPTASSARNRLAARVVSVVPLGSTVSIELECGFPLKAQVTRPALVELGLEPGQAVIALIKAPAIHLVPRG